MHLFPGTYLPPGPGLLTCGHCSPMLRVRLHGSTCLVAQDGGEVVGHIAFSPVTVTSNEKSFDGVGLAPMAVSPDRQRTGIGVD